MDAQGVRHDEQPRQPVGFCLEERSQAGTRSRWSVGPAGRARPAHNVGVRAMIAFLAVAAVMAGCTNGASTQAPAGSKSRALLVFTTWAKDAAVTNGPQPGYRPALTGLTSREIASAAPIIDASGSTWLIAITFTPSGRRLFTNLTAGNVAACPGDAATTPSANCPERHLAVWLDLTQSDIDHWEDPSYVAKVARQFDLPCLTGAASIVECGKFVSDPITIEPITGAQAQIAGNFTQQTAQDFAAAISPSG